MKVCPSCQSQYPDDASSCGRCGASLVPDMHSRPDPQRSMVGRVIGGNYRVERLLGKGGMGTVFQARQLSLDRDVAIKVLLSPMAMEGQMLERFQREARASSNIGHPGIVQVIDLGYLEEGLPFIAMEMLSGEDLRAKLSREGALGPDQAVPLMLQTCDALQAAHDKGIVHRDLKPDNLFLVYRQGRVPMLKILDFGLSKIKGTDQKLTDTGALLGTPNYMSPEQVKGDLAVDHRTDIYACGAILYEMLTGKPAYDGPTVQSILVSIMTEDPASPRSLRPEMAPELEAIVLRAMARNPDDRYQTIGEMGYELARAGSAIGISSSQLDQFSTPPPSSRPGSGYRPTPAYTPAPVSMPASSVATKPRGSPKGLIIGLVVGLLVLMGAALLVMGGTGAVMFLLTRDAGEEEGHQRVTEAPREDPEMASGTEVEFEEEIQAQIQEALGSVAPGGDEKKSGAPSLGQGTRPHLCCYAEGCALVYQDGGTHGMGKARVHLTRLSASLEPAGEPVALSPEDESSIWPTCFARDDGGFLVLYQQQRDPFDLKGQVHVHRVVVDSTGKAGERMTHTFKNSMGTDTFDPSYFADAFGDRVALLWESYHRARASMHLTVYDMDGKEVVDDVTVVKRSSVTAPTIRCMDDRCAIGWVRSSGQGHTRELALVTTSGKVQDAQIDAFNRGVLVRKSMVVSLKDRVAYVWAEQESMSAEATQYVALFDWKGKQVLGPTEIEPFGRHFGYNDHLRYASSPPDGTSLIIARPWAEEGVSSDQVMVVTLDAEGKVTSEKVLDPGGVSQAWVFHTAGGKPAVVYTDSVWDDGDLYAELL